MHSPLPEERLNVSRTFTDAALISMVGIWGNITKGSETAEWGNEIHGLFQVLGERVVADPIAHSDAKLLVDAYLMFAGSYAGFGSAWTKSREEVADFASHLTKSHFKMFADAKVDTYDALTYTLPKPSPSPFSREFRRTS